MVLADVGPFHVAGHERRWPAAVVAVLGLQMALPSEVTAGPWWLLPALEIALLAPVAVANPVRLSADTPWLRRAALALTGLSPVYRSPHNFWYRQRC